VSQLIKRQQTELAVGRLIMNYASAHQVFRLGNLREENKGSRKRSRVWKEKATLARRKILG